MLLFWALLSSPFLLGLILAENLETTAIEIGRPLQLQCLKRDDNGEAVEDEDKQRTYIPFLTCNETGYPPSFAFRTSTLKHKIPCTITIDDPTFHFFQAYLHHDLPLVCRLPARKQSTDLRIIDTKTKDAEEVESGPWVHIPINLVGKAELSHFDIETRINFIFHYDRWHHWVSGGVGYSFGSVVGKDTEEEELGWKRVKIGDQVQLNFSIRWISTDEIPNQHSHSGSNALLIMAYPFLGGIGFMVLCRVLYSVLWSRQKIASVASVRQQTRLDTPGINFGKAGKTKREREMV